MSKNSGLRMKYFVLKPDGDDNYAYASRRAMLAYAEAIEQHDLELAEGLWKWVYDIRMEVEQSSTEKDL